MVWTGVIDLIMQNIVCAPQLMLICISCIWIPQEGSVFLMFEVYVASLSLCQISDLMQPTSNVLFIL